MGKPWEDLVYKNAWNKRIPRSFSKHTFKDPGKVRFIFQHFRFIEISTFNIAFEISCKAYIAHSNLLFP